MSIKFLLLTCSLSLIYAQECPEVNMKVVQRLQDAEGNWQALDVWTELQESDRFCIPGNLQHTTLLDLKKLKRKCKCMTDWSLFTHKFVTVPDEEPLYFGRKDNQTICVDIKLSCDVFILNVWFVNDVYLLVQQAPSSPGGKIPYMDLASETFMPQNEVKCLVNYFNKKFDLPPVQCCQGCTA